jgi:tRNA uridine 5-carbamoylmethylation protein Kti12
MVETSTLNELTNQNEVMKESVKENLEADDLIFYHSLRPQLDLLQKNPPLSTTFLIIQKVCGKG